jgi:hypothetical protein
MAANPTKKANNSDRIRPFYVIGSVAGETLLLQRVSRTSINAAPLQRQFGIDRIGQDFSGHLDENNLQTS